MRPNSQRVRLGSTFLVVLFLLLIMPSAVLEAQEQPPISDANALAWTAREFYRPNEEITVHFHRLPGNRYDWISLAAVDSPDNIYLRYFYGEGASSGTMTFAGLDAGMYEVRVYFNWAAGGYIVQSRYPFTVTDRVPEPVTIEPFELDTAPDKDILAWTHKVQYGPDEEIDVSFWDLPANRYDWITLSQQGTGDSSYVRWAYTQGTEAGSLSFPSLQPGAYEVRVYFNWSAGGYTVHSRYPFVVTGQPAAERDPTRSPGTGILAWTELDRYRANEEITVRFASLPGSNTDWISLAAADSGDSSYLRWGYTQGDRSGVMSFEGLAPGRYEVRVYFNWAAGGYTVHSRFPFVIE